MRVSLHRCIHQDANECESFTSSVNWYSCLHEKAHVAGTIRVRGFRRGVGVGGRVSAGAALAFLDGDDVTLCDTLGWGVPVCVRGVLEQHLVLVRGHGGEFVDHRLVEAGGLGVESHHCEINQLQIRNLNSYSVLNFMVKHNTATFSTCNNSRSF